MVPVNLQLLLDGEFQTLKRVMADLSPAQLNQLEEMEGDGQNRTDYLDAIDAAFIANRG